MLGTGMVLCLVALPARAVERHVPSEYATIQAAIDAAVEGDHVVIAPDTYQGDGNRDLDYGGKAITVRSEDPDDPNVVEATIIKCNPHDPNDPDDPNFYENHRGFHFHNGEGPSSVVAGLTITSGVQLWGSISVRGQQDATLGDNVTKGSKPQLGGGMYIEWSRPAVVCCVFSGNRADYGGGMYIRNGDPVVTRCTFRENEAGRGGGIANYASAPTVTNSLFTGNRGGSWTGAAIENYSGSATISHCTFVENLATGPGGGSVYNENSSPTIVNCIFWSNEPDEIVDASGSAASVSHSCIEGGWPGPGNIDADPCFVDADGPDDDPNTWDDNDYHLAADSPCVNAGDPNFVADPTHPTDIDGQGRTNGIVDMGSDEVWPAGVCTLGMSVVNGHMGQVTVSPNVLLDPNDDPNDPNVPRQVAIGTLVTLTAAPVEGKAFKHWLIFDPNHPGDAYYAAKDANLVLRLVMDDDHDVQAYFTCGGGAGVMLPVMLGAVGLMVIARRRGGQI